MHLPLVLICFFLSGLTALVYQTAWTREFAFVFGTSELAVATVLAAYMGGLSLGAAVAARWSSRVRRPVLVYGFLELGIAVSALLVPAGLTGATRLYGWLFAGHTDVGGLTTGLFYAGCAFVVLALPTAFMGATLPLLAGHSVRNDRELGPRIGLLYSVNTLGAVAGTVGAAWVLLPLLGLGGTVVVAVVLNGLVFLLAAWAARGAPLPSGLGQAPARAAVGGGWILPAILVSGAASFTYEVLWTRILGHVLGASVYAFATMLASFLFGIAAGAALASRFATSRRRAALGFAVAQLGTAVLSLAAFALSDRLPDVMRTLALGSLGREAGHALVAAGALLPSTLCIGATFPFAVRVLARGETEAASASARVYAWNTLGAITGALGAGFFLVPAIGFAGSFQAAALTNAGLAVLAAWWAEPAAAGGSRGSRPLVAAALVLALVVAFVSPPLPWNVLRHGPLKHRSGTGEVAFFEVGRSATVLLLENRGRWWLRTNGLPESSIRAPGHPPSDGRTARWLGLLPALARPDARSLLVIGLGGGVAVEEAAESFERIDVVELEPEVVRANQSIAELREIDPLGDPRVRVIENDARGALVLSAERYDAIVSQPSHPWTAGASHLYTREFFELAREHLTPDGVLLQWIGTSFVDEVLFRVLVATLADVFEHVAVHQAHKGGGILLLGSDAPLDVVASAEAAFVAAPRSCARAGLYRPEDVAATLLLDDSAARRFAAGSKLNLDRRNHLQMDSPRVSKAVVPEQVLLADGLVPQAGMELDRLLLLRRLAALGFRDRAHELAGTITEPAERAVARGILAERKGAPGSARRAYEDAVRLDPRMVEARAGLVRLLGKAAHSDGVLSVADAGSAERAILRAWDAEGSEESDLGEIDAALARVEPGAPFFGTASRLRVQWRLRAGDPARAREAVEILDVLVARGSAPKDLLVRARAAASAGDTGAALASLDSWQSQVSPEGRQRGLSVAAAVLRQIDPEPDRAAWHKWLESQIARPGRSTR